MPFVPWKTMVVGPPQAVDQRPDEKWREGSTGAPTAAGGASARSRSPGRGELVSSVGGSGHRMAGLVCLPLRWCCHAGAHTVPCFCSQEKCLSLGSAVGLGYSGILLTGWHHCFDSEVFSGQKTIVLDLLCLLLLAWKHC